MTEKEEEPTESREHNHRVVDREINRGSARYRWQERQTASGETNVEIRKEKQMHRFATGYENRGRPHPLTQELTLNDARAVRELLDAWIQKQENKSTEESG